MELASMHADNFPCLSRFCSPSTVGRWRWSNCANLPTGKQMMGMGDADGDWEIKKSIG